VRGGRVDVRAVRRVGREQAVVVEERRERDGPEPAAGVREEPAAVEQVAGGVGERSVHGGLILLKPGFQGKNRASSIRRSPVSRADTGLRGRGRNRNSLQLNSARATVARPCSVATATEAESWSAVGSRPRVRRNARVTWASTSL